MTGIAVREQKEVEVNGRKYVLTAFPASKGLKFQKYLLKVAGPAYIESQKEGSSIADVITKVLSNIDDIDENVIKEMITLSTDMNPSKFEIEFSGKTMDIYVLLRHIVFFNYSDVFTLLGLEQMEESNQ